MSALLRNTYLTLLHFTKQFNNGRTQTNKKVVEVSGYIQPSKMNNREPTVGSDVLTNLPHSRKKSTCMIV